MGAYLLVSNVFDIPSVIDQKNLPFILNRLNAEKFDKVKALTTATVGTFRKILDDFFNGKITYEKACVITETQIVLPPNYRRYSQWAERLVRSEMSKIFTLGYGDYLLSIGETECFIPHTKLDESTECQALIAGKKFPIKDIQNNIYKNYGLKKPAFPTVPLHANCRHVITKIP